MKKIYFIFLAFVTINTFAQNNVGIGIATPDPSAVLDLTSTKQGFLIPRMNAVQRQAIATPATGLIVFDTDTGCTFFYTGAVWKNMCVNTGGGGNNAGGLNDSVNYNPDGSVSVTDGGGTKTTLLHGWLSNGNSGTMAGTNFAGTTDAQDYVMKSNNSEVIRATTNGAVGINQPAPAAGAVLDVVSATKGVLIPRTKVALIAIPATGMMIFDTDSNCFCYYTGTLWKNLCSAAVPNAWQLQGNAGTVAGTNFAGTTDAQDFVLKSNSAEVMRVTTAGAVGINQPAPNADAILEVKSTSKGILFPSLTSTQRDAIANPPVGLTVYNNTLNVHQFWNGTCWVNVGQTVCSFTYTTSISHNTDCLLRTNFKSVSDTITVSLVSGTPAPVILTASGVPAGVLVNFSNSYVTPTATSVVTFTALPSAAIGTFNITILASSGSTIQTLNYTLTVYDYNLAVNPTLDSVNQLGFAPNHLTAVTTVSMTNPGACGQGNTTAILTATGVPNGVTASFGNSTMVVPGSTSLTFTSSSCAVVGTYTVTVIATLGAVQTSINYTLIVDPSVMNITASANNINLWALAGSPNCPVNLTVNIPAGVQIGSTTTTLPALNTGNFAGGSLITLDIAGIIAGHGGNGGDDSGMGLLANCRVDGFAGGDAISLGSAGVTINNTGTIGGGGGGGGAGGSLNQANLCGQGYDGTGGGGGAGAMPGNGGLIGTTFPLISLCAAGNSGTLLTGGTGGSNAACTVTGLCALGATYQPGMGGTGGGLGQAGQPGGNVQGITILSGTGFCGTGTGGAAGCPVRANTYSYTLNGPVLGTPCP